MFYWSLCCVLFFSSSVWAATDPDLTVEWFPNDSYFSKQYKQDVYPLGHSAPAGTKMGVRMVLWLEQDIDCESLEDPYYPGQKVLHLFLDGPSSGFCPKHRFAHFDALGGFCTDRARYPDQNRVEWRILLPTATIGKREFGVILWAGSKMLTPEEIGPDTSIGFLMFVDPPTKNYLTPKFIHCRDTWH